MDEYTLEKVTQEFNKAISTMPENFADKLCDAYDLMQKLDYILDLAMFEIEEGIPELLECDYEVDSYDHSVLIRLKTVPENYVVPEIVKERVKLLGFSKVWWYNKQKEIKT